MPWAESTNSQFRPLGKSVFAGVPIHRTSLDQAVEGVVSTALHRTGGVAVRLVNAHSIVVCQREPDYRELLRDNGVNLPDGLPLAKALSILDPVSGAGRVRGPSLFEAVLEASQETGARHFLLGGTESLLGLLLSVVAERYPGCNVVGTYAPPFCERLPAELSIQDGLIRSSGADIVWVGLGAPKQDFEASRLAAECGVVAVGVGAAFDFLSGSKRMAPLWMQNAGLEWLFRLLSEPRRLWRRYVVGNAIFLRVVLAEARCRWP